MPVPGCGPVVVIGVGNEFRRDDGAGPAVVERLRDHAPSGVGLVTTDGEPTRLIEAWTGAALAVVVDAVRAQPPHPGRVHRFVVDRPGAGARRTASSHGFGLDDAVGLAVALDRMPGRLIVHAIEAADLTQGTGLTPAVAAAVGVVAAAVLDDIGASRRLLPGCPGSEPKDLGSRDLSPLPMLVPEDQLVQCPRAFVPYGAEVIVFGSLVSDSVLSPEVWVDSWSRVNRAVILHNSCVGQHAVVDNAILDKGVVVADGATVGVDKGHDLARGFTVSSGGVTVVGKGQKVTT